MLGISPQKYIHQAVSRVKLAFHVNPICAVRPKGRVVAGCNYSRVMTSHLHIIGEPVPDA